MEAGATGETWRVLLGVQQLFPFYESMSSFSEVLALKFLILSSASLHRTGKSLVVVFALRH